MQNNETTMWDLLTSLKKITMSYGNGQIGSTLTPFKTFKRGILSPNTVFPAIAFLPLGETITKIYSGGKYSIKRDVNVTIVTKSAIARDSLEQAMDLSNKWKNIFRDTTYPNNFLLADDSSRPTTYDYSIGQITYGEVEDNQKASLLQEVTIPVSFWSREYFPTEEIATTLSEESSKDAGIRIFEGLTEYSTLSNVKFFYKTTMPPIPVDRGIVITVMPDQETHEWIETGHSNITRNIDIFVWTKASPFEEMLEMNLITMERVKDYLQTNLQWGGYAKNSAIEGIRFGLVEESLLYNTQIDLRIEAREVIPQT